MLFSRTKPCMLTYKCRFLSNEVVIPVQVGRGGGRRAAKFKIDNILIILFIKNYNAKIWKIPMQASW